MKRQPRRQYFLIYPPTGILEVYTLKQLIDRHVLHLASEIEKSEILQKQVMVLDHNVHVAEHEIALWCTRMDFSYDLLADDDLLASCFEDFKGADFPEIRKVVRELRSVVGHFPFGGDLLDSFEFFELLAQQLRQLVHVHRSKEAKACIQPARNLTRAGIDLFFDFFPIEEFRTPLLAAIAGAQKAGGVYWTSYMTKLYGPSERPRGVLRQAPWKKGESWREALMRDEDDIEPWMDE